MIWIEIIICSIISGLFVTVSCRDLHVDIAGNDSESCGNIKTPCATIRHAISRSAKFDQITVSSGTYRAEASEEAVAITRSLMIRANVNSTVTIECDTNTTHYKLYHVQPAPNATVKFTLQNINVVQCSGAFINRTSTLPDGLLVVSGGELVLKESSFVNVGRVVHHGYSSRMDGASSIKILVENSQFVSDDGEYAMSLTGSGFVFLVLTNSTFNGSFIRVDSGNQTTLTAEHCLFTQQQHHPGPAAVDITMATGNNVITFTNCNFTDLRTQYISGVQLAIDALPSSPPIIHFNNVRFTNNYAGQTNGGIFSIFTRLNTACPVNVKLVMKKCEATFNRNTIFGGAFHLAGISGASFVDVELNNNQAVAGGAIYIRHCRNIKFTSTTFINNTAVSTNNDQPLTRGGALLISQSHVRLDNVSFVNNQATFEGNAIYSHNTDQSVILDENYIEQSKYFNGTIVTLLGDTPMNPAGAGPVMSFTKVNITVPGYGSRILMLMGDVGQMNNTLMCPSGYHTITESNAYANGCYSIYSYRCRGDTISNISPIKRGDEKCQTYIVDYLDIENHWIYNNEHQENEVFKYP